MSAFKKHVFSYVRTMRKKQYSWLKPFGRKTFGRQKNSKRVGRTA